MKEFFEEYAWTAVTVLGGAIGVMIFLALCYGEGSMLSSIIDDFLGGIM